MNPIRIAAAPSTSARPADAPSGGSNADSDFGPILQSMSAAPACAAPHDASREAPQEAPPGDPAQAKADGAPAQRSGRRNAEAQPPPDPAAAAAAACAASHGVASPTDAAAAIAQAASTLAAAAATPVPAADTTRTVAALDPKGATLVGQATAAAVATDPAVAVSGTATQAASNASVQTKSDPLAGGAAAQPADGTPHTGRASTPAAQVDADLGGTNAGSDGNAVFDPPAAGARAAAIPPSQQMQAVALAVASALAPAATKGSDAATARAGTGATVPGDPSALSTSSAAGAFAPAAPYSPDAHAGVATPVGQPGFGEELSQRVIVLARGGVQSAQISLDPAGLGPVGVSIQVHGHAVALAFTAAHEATRGALEAALPRLREMFASCGMQLSDAAVGGRSHSDWSMSARPQSAGQEQGGGSSDPAAAPGSDPISTATATALRLVDTYA